MSQPEANLSRRIIKHLLDRFPGSFFVKVHGGPSQRAGLPDIIGCVPTECPRCGYGPVGLFIGLETKMPGNKPTALQAHTLKQLALAGAVTSVVYSAVDAEAMVDSRWLFSPPASDSPRTSDTRDG